MIILAGVERGLSYESIQRKKRKRQTDEKPQERTIICFLEFKKWQAEM